REDDRRAALLHDEDARGAVGAEVLLDVVAELAERAEEGRVGVAGPHGDGDVGAGDVDVGRLRADAAEVAGGGEVGVERAAAHGGDGDAGCVARAVVDEADDALPGVGGAEDEAPAHVGVAAAAAGGDDVGDGRDLVAGAAAHLHRDLAGGA